MTDKLTLYQLALGHLGSRRLGSLSEAREPRLTLDDFYASTMAVCLMEGLWKFAKRVVQIDASTTITPAFGYLYAFPIPPDWVRTISISANQTLDPPLTDVPEETGYWYANWTPIFLSYISNDPLYGGNLGSWPATFERYFAAQLALDAAPRITNNDAAIINRLCDENGRGIVRNLRINSRSKDAMNDPPGFAPQSTWVRSRRGFMAQTPDPASSGASDGGNFFP
jgi:hypothetical protein